MRDAIISRVNLLFIDQLSNEWYELAGVRERKVTKLLQE